MSITRRRLPALLGLALASGATGLAGTGLAGCGLLPADRGRAASSSDGRSAAPLDPPVVVEHRFGRTTLRRVPRRIVTIDLQWTDVMLAMGVRPLGCSLDARMPKAGVPWQKGRLNTDDTTMFVVETGVPTERIAALEPDLIVGAFSIGDRPTYARLAGIAPTIPALDASQVTPWQDMMRVAGRVLDEPAKASGIVGSVVATVATTAKRLPGLKNRTFELAQYIVGDSMYIVADEHDGSSVLFRELGMRLFPPVVREGARSRLARINVSRERADLLRADFVAFLVNGGGRSRLADIPGFDKLPGTVAVLDYPTVVGLNTPSPLSTPYALTRLRPYLARVAQGEPG